MKFLAIVAAICVSVVLAKNKRHEKHDPIDKHHYQDGEHDEGYDHEAVLGSRDSEDEYSRMDPEEARDKLGLLVDEMDTNKDEKINKPELIQWIKTSFSKLNAEESNKEFEKIDEDHDTFITWSEYLEYEHSQTLDQLEKIRKGSDPEMKDFIAIVADDEAKFKAADQNNDGKLDTKEFAAFYHPTLHANMFHYELKKKLDALDANKDGKINVDEYLHELDDATKKEPETIKSEKETFNGFDTNKDGVLDSAEMEKWIMDAGDHHEGDLAKEEAEHLIAETDANGDKLLSKDEILDKYSLWVGSQATNYGKHWGDEL